MTIVLLEDDEAIARGLGRLATRLGHELIHARNIREAQSAFDGRAVHVLFADLGLGGGENGIDALLWAKKHAPGTTRVLMSGAMDPATTGGLSWDKSLAKPFGSQEFSSILESVAGISPAR